ncbi:MAG: histidine--tRNA ligase [Spirochaetales bacterium]|nr:histidine--tRNA ligase [Spirochaetales bacterium]MBQ4501369.1 histidine--tRNA ligase [Spirochaetales bacterium]MBQ7282127.1 histidine--tRNA ligase [Spirochaetales bacterium]
MLRCYPQQGLNMIEPKVLKGFRDSLPQQEIVRQKLMAKVQQILRSFGFVPIDTPALEYTEVLLGKGGGETDKQMFRFTDNGGRDVALRFDLTVPLARFVAANQSQLSFPFKRYHISKVWRGEKPQKGRYREFWQCDFDMVGVDNAQSDFEILLLIHTCLTEMKVGAFKVSVSHRGLLNRFLTSLGIQDKNADVLRAIDKLGKIGRDGVSEILKEDGLSDENIAKVLDFISIDKTSFEKTLLILSDMFGECPEITRLSELLQMMKACSIEDDFVLDTSITRGLDYYTGIVYETLLLDMPQIGSICSGGRYNNLAGLYTKENLPGVGSCIGLDRLIAALEELKSPIVTDASYADVMVVGLKDNPAWSESTAMKLRALGVRTDSYVGEKGLGQQFAYAEKNGIPYVVTSQDGELYSVKEIATRRVMEGMTLQDIAKLAMRAE